nr:hypothetical protein [Bacilli bacterium]
MSIKIHFSENFVYNNNIQIHWGDVNGGDYDLYRTDFVYNLFDYTMFYRLMIKEAGTKLASK